MALHENSILEALKTVRIPGSNAALVDSQKIGRIDVREEAVVVEILLTEPNPLVEKSLQFQIEKAIQTLSASVQVAVEFRVVQPASPQKKNQIGSIIAIGSGKGGVGKSAVAVNLAVAIQKLGIRVGLLDCDLYGPSIPLMLGVPDKKPLMMNGKIQPIEAYGLKIMSTGFLVEPGQGLVWRGPMIHKLIQQFFQDVDWSDIDVLLVDLPPGTGDAPLSLSQVMPLTGAVMVSMPQKVSLIDVHKGLSMFRQVKIPILGVVENMSHFVCPSCSHDEEIFDRGGVKKFCAELQVPYLGDIPIDPKIREASDEGMPFLLKYPDRPAAKTFHQMAERLSPFLKTQDDAVDSELKIVL